MVRLHTDQLVALDEWVARQRDQPTRPEAIRRLVQTALVHQPLTPGKEHKGAARAREMAIEAMRGHLTDLPDEERATRKARLLTAGAKTK